MESPGPAAPPLGFEEKAFVVGTIGVFRMVVATPAKKKSKKRQAQEDLKALQDMAQGGRGEAMATAQRQIRTVSKVAAIALVVIWLLALGFWGGLHSRVPIYVALGFTIALAVGAFVIWRNLGKSNELGALLGDASDLTPEEKQRRIDKLEARVQKGDAAASITKAQLVMQDAPKEALTILEAINLDKTQKAVAHQVRGMRAMIHLNAGEVKMARALADDIDLGRVPDLKGRANLSAIVAEAWARSGNPIEGGELLDKYDVSDKAFKEIEVQLLRARVFACVHQSNFKAMKKAVKQLCEISPQLLGIFVGQKRIHPLLQQEARKQLEKSGLMPKQRIQAARR